MSMAMVTEGRSVRLVRNTLLGSNRNDCLVVHYHISLLYAFMNIVQFTLSAYSC